MSVFSIQHALVFWDQEGNLILFCTLFKGGNSFPFPFFLKVYKIRSSSPPHHLKKLKKNLVEMIPSQSLVNNWLLNECCTLFIYWQSTRLREYATERVRGWESTRLRGYAADPAPFGHTHFLATPTFGTPLQTKNSFPGTGPWVIIYQTKCGQ